MSARSLIISQLELVAKGLSLAPLSLMNWRCCLRASIRLLWPFEISGATHNKPITITTTGSKQTRTWHALLLKTFRVTDQVLITAIIDGSKAAVRWRADIHSKIITGNRVATCLLDLIEVEDRRVASHIEFSYGTTSVS
jgi:hypothetical protein